MQIDLPDEAGVPSCYRLRNIGASPVAIDPNPVRTVFAAAHVTAIELIRRTRAELPEALIFNGCGNDHLAAGMARSLDDPLASFAALAVSRLGEGNSVGFHAVLDPTVPLACLIFRAPTQHYKNGVVFFAWLNGFQDHFVMLGGVQGMRPLPCFVELFKLADGCGLLVDPELACDRMKKFLAIYGA